MTKKTLKRLLDDIVSGKELVPLFIGAKQSPALVYWALKRFLEDPDISLARKVTKKYKVDSLYLFDRIQGLLAQIDHFRSTDPYSVFSLTYQADASAIQNQWKTMLKEWHPDKGKDGEESLSMTHKINDAYKILRTPDLRKAYDRQYAPLLAIIKDIEEQPVPHSGGGRPGPFLKLKFVLPVVVAVSVGAYFWAINRHEVKRREAVKAEKPVRNNAARVAVARKKKEKKTVPEVKSVLRFAYLEQIAEAGVGVDGTSYTLLQAPPPLEKNKVKQDVKKTVVAAAEKYKKKAPEKIKQDAGPETETKARAAKISKPVPEKKPDIAESPPAAAVDGDYFKNPAGAPGKKEEKPVKKPAEEKKIPAKAAPAGVRVAEHDLSDPKEVIKRYFDYYRQGNYAALFSLFDKNAVENGLPIRKSLENYRIFTRCLNVVRFDFKNNKALGKGDKYFIDGNYVMEYKKPSGGKRFKNSGKISFVVVRERDIWLIRELNYYEN